MRQAFTKMHGAGNDFVVIDATQEEFVLGAAQLRRLADRHFGVGCDQVLVVERSGQPGVDFRYRIFNADGGEVEQCGNGARCFVRYVHDKGLSSKREIRVETLSGTIVPRLEPDGEIAVDMGAPIFDLARVPFRTDHPGMLQHILIGQRDLEIAVLSMGNPHAVQVVDDIESAPVATEGPLIEMHAAFSRRVNAGYMQILARGRIALRVWERGAGETLACGTGACAAVASGIARGMLDARVRVDTRGGALTVTWTGGENPVWLKGPAETVFEGSVDL